MQEPDIIFPNIGIELMNVDSVAFSLFGLEVYWYGIFICAGFLLGLTVASALAKRAGQEYEYYSEYLIYALIAAIVGARLYYVLFSWSDYKDNLMDIFALRNGGLAIYGGIIGAVLTALIYTRIKGYSFLKLLDAGAGGLLIGQIVGRMGNFVNMEAFGSYTNNFFAMQIKASEAKIPSGLSDDAYVTLMNGVQYIQVHPTFMYEALWNLGVLIFIWIYFNHKKFHGEVFCIYLVGYGIGRFWIEGLRTDQLIIGNSGIPVSQLLAGVLVVVAIGIIIIKRLYLKKQEA